MPVRSRRQWKLSGPKSQPEADSTQSLIMRVHKWAGPIETLPLTDWRLQFDVLFFGPIALTQQLLPQLRASRGRVINVTSIGGIMPGPMIAAYQAAKAALEAVSDSMRIEFSPFDVHVSAIAPGSISTPMLNRSPDHLNRLADALPKSL